MSLSGEAGGIRGVIGQMFYDGVSALSASPENEMERRRLAEMAGQQAPLSITMGWLAITLGSLWLAHRLLRRWNRGIRPALPFQAIRVPRWNAVLLGGALIALLLGSGDVRYLGFVAAIVLATPYFLVGIGIIHRLARGWGPGPLFLIGFYVAMFLSMWLACAAAALGFADQWTKLREKIDGPQPV